MWLQIVAAMLCALCLTTAGLAGAQEPDLFPLTRDRCGTLGVPPNRADWELIGARWFKPGDCSWQADWVADSDVQPWLLVRPQMFFTGNNREWNPLPNPPSWRYRDQVRQFIEENCRRIGIIALGNSICCEDVEDGYPDGEQYVGWYHEFAGYVRSLNPAIKLAPGDLQSAWGTLQGTDLLETYLAAYQRRYGEPMPIDAVGLHCYLTGNAPPEWAQPEEVSVQAYGRKIRAMRQFMKHVGLQDTALVITEMGVFNHCCDPPLSDTQLISIMEGAIELMEGPQGIDEELGMPSDGFRLVQKWSYSAYSHLVQNGALTAMGQAYRRAIERWCTK